MRRPSIPLSRPNGRGHLGSVSKIFPPVRPPPTFKTVARPALYLSIARLNSFISATARLHNR